MRDGSDSEQLSRVLTIRPLRQRNAAVMELSYHTNAEEDARTALPSHSS